MAKEWTDEEVQAEIQAAVKIVAEDRERAEYNRLHGVYGPKEVDAEDGKTPPPKKEDKKTTEDAPKKRKSMWWGETDAD